MKLEKIGFIGLGLIGGSIAIKIKENHPDCEIIATARRKETITEAYNMGLISNSELLSLNSFADCNLIFLCAPVEKNLDYLRELKDIISSHTLITDVGSTKGQIHKEVIALGLEKQFIGGHPMTGSEKTGISNATKYLLENAYYIITPTKENSQEQIDGFYALVKELGSIPLVLDYDAHDYATASISHLPHMIAYTLVNLVKDIDDENETMKTIAAGGFKDITRIASSSPVMWESICMTNQEQLIKLMDKYIDSLSELRNDIKDASSQTLLNKFQSAKDYRDSLTVRNTKSYNKVHELFLDLADETGGIAIIASLLAFKGISIKNIGIVHNREFEEGVLHIEFYDAESVEIATEILQNKNYTVHRR
ncbi:MAG: prephenate dehydrogenase/arogenate dehydrogenase family protein [Agathobacter sp.]|nr:prephenate dehydrogenase/arogenate dehydrogenase family protein [Agathobacter sp.]